MSAIYNSRGEPIIGYGQGQGDESQTLTAADFINGYWTSEIAFSNSSKRITTRDVLVLGPGDTLTYQAKTLQMQIQEKRVGESSYTEVQAFAANTERVTLTYSGTTFVLIICRLSSNGNFTADAFDGAVTITRARNGDMLREIDALKSVATSVETLSAADFVQGTRSVRAYEPLDVMDTLAAQNYTLTLKRVFAMRKGDVLMIKSPNLTVEVKALPSGEAEGVTVLPFTVVPEPYGLIMPFDTSNVLVQLRKTVKNAVITPADYDADITLIRTTAITGERMERTPRMANVQTFAHRGDQELFPENSLAAFRSAARRGFTGFETDVQFTADLVPVIIHDRTINDTARNLDGTELEQTVRIDEITYAQALAYDFGIWFGTEFAGTKIPTFEQMIALAKDLGLRVRIELKTETVTTERIPALIAIVRKYGMIKNVEWASFGSNLLQYIAENHPTYDLCYITSTISSGTVTIAEGLKTGKNNVIIAAGSFGPEQVQMLMEAEIPLDVWTIKSPGAILNADPYVSSFTSNRYIAAEVLYGRGLNPTATAEEEEES